MKIFISTYTKQDGTGLLEVVVALLLLGVGLLGVMSLQTKGLNSNQRAVFVTEAQILVQDMADRILAYGNTELNGNSGASDGVYTGISINVGEALTSASCSGASGCTPAESVAYDTNEWRRALKTSSLPRAIAKVNWDSVNSKYIIEVMWDQERDPSALATVTCTKKNCYTMEVRLNVPTT